MRCESETKQSFSKPGARQPWRARYLQCTRKARYELHIPFGDEGAIRRHCCAECAEQRVALAKSRGATVELKKIP